MGIEVGEKTIHSDLGQRLKRALASASNRGMLRLWDKADNSVPTFLARVCLSKGNGRVVCSLTSHSERLFVLEYSRHCCGRREKSSNNGMVTLWASGNTESEHAMLAAAALTTQTLAARAISRQTNGGLQASRLVASESRGLAHSWWSAAVVRLVLAACALSVGIDVGAGKSGRRECWTSKSPGATRTSPLLLSSLESLFSLLSSQNHI
jgi:hypothetical protein